jgi:hypothetical protein
MKRLFLLFFCSALLWAGSSDYSVNIHVTATHMVRDHSDSARRQKITVRI